MRGAFLLGGMSALAVGALLSAQQPAQAAVPASNNDSAVMDRLNALEAKVRALEARNGQLEADAAKAATRMGKVELGVAKGVQPGVAPTFGDVTDSFSFHPRGTIQMDYAAYHTRAGGYDFNDGTDLRRARFGFEGTAWKVWDYRIEAEFVKNNVNLLDAYLQYTGVKNLLVTVGQHKTPYGLEANSRDAINTFLERGMFVDAFISVGADRRIGVSAAYRLRNFTATIGLFGAGEAVQRNVATPDEPYGVNGRITFEPVLAPGRIVHVGASAFHVSHLGGDSVTLSDRTGARGDNGLLEALTLGPDTTGATPTRGARNATYWGAEGAVVHGLVSLQGEYGHIVVNRYDGAPSGNFDGYYGFATYSLTGEHRKLENGLIDRIEPFKDFNPGAGHWGAFELAARYDHLDLTDHDISPLRRVGESYTGGLNWYLNPRMRFVFNYIRFKGTNSPLAVAPVAINGTTAKGDAYATRLQFDF